MANIEVEVNLDSDFVPTVEITQPDDTFRPLVVFPFMVRITNRNDDRPIRIRGMSVEVWTKQWRYISAVLPKDGQEGIDVTLNALQASGWITGFVSLPFSSHIVYGQACPDDTHVRLLARRVGGLCRTQKVVIPADKWWSIGRMPNITRGKDQDDADCPCQQYEEAVVERQRNTG